MASPTTSGQEVAAQRALLCLSARTTDLDYGERTWTRKSSEGMPRTALEGKMSKRRGGQADFAVPDAYWVYVFQKSASGWRLRHELKRSGFGYDAADWGGGIGQSEHAALTGAAAQPAMRSQAYPSNGIPFSPADQNALFLSRIRLSHARVQQYLSRESLLLKRSDIWLPDFHGKVVIDTQRERSDQYRAADQATADLVQNFDLHTLTALPARRLVEVGGKRVERCWVPLTEPLTYAEDLRVYQQKSLVRRAALSENPTDVKLRAYSKLLYGAARRSEKARGALAFSKLASYATAQESIVANAERDAAVSTSRLVRALSGSSYAAAIHDHARDPEHEMAAAASYAEVSKGCLYDRHGLAYLARNVTEKDDGLLIGFLYGSGFQAWRKQAAAADTFLALLATLAAGDTVRLTGQISKRRTRKLRKALLKVRKKIRKAVKAGKAAGIFEAEDLRLIGKIDVGRYYAKGHPPRIQGSGTGQIMLRGRRQEKALETLGKLGGTGRGLVLILELTNLAAATCTLPAGLQSTSKKDRTLALVGIVGSFADAVGAAEFLLEKHGAGKWLLQTRIGGRVITKGLPIVGAVCDYVGGLAGAAEASHKGQKGQAIGHATSALAAVALGAGGVLSSGAAGAAGAVAFGLTGPALIAIGAVLFAVGTAVLWLTEEDPPLVQHAKQSPWRKGAVASDRPTGIKESALNQQMDSLLHLLVRYKVDVTLKKQRVEVDGQKNRGLLLTAEVTANMLLPETRFTVPNVTLYRVGHSHGGRDEVIELHEAIPPEESLVLAKQSFPNVRQRAFHSKALASDTSTPVYNTRIDEETMLGIWETRTYPKGEALFLEIALPLDYTIPAVGMVEDPYTRELRPGPPLEVSQLKPGFMGLKWKGEDYGAEITLQALPVSHMAPISVKDDATTY